MAGKAPILSGYVVSILVSGCFTLAKLVTKRGHRVIEVAARFDF